MDGSGSHVHLLLVFPATIRLMDLMRDLKSGSAHLMLATLKPDTWFDWQNGYAAIAVSPSHRRRIIAYIQNQKQHHSDSTTKELFERDGAIYETDEEAPEERA